jgi:hypothetical protein
MARLGRMLCFAVIAGVTLAAPVLAQSSSENRRSGGVAQEFNAGANRVGQGAAQIGEGIKDGAIMTWHAFRDGANAFASRFSADRASPVRGRGPSAQ